MKHSKREILENSLLVKMEDIFYSRTLKKLVEISVVKFSRRHFGN